MALISTNHRMLYVIGSSGGSFTGVITDETLTGNGTSAFPLGVNESALAPSEAEIYVQTNSGDLNEVSGVVQSNSANWNSITGMSGAYVPLSSKICLIGTANSADDFAFYTSVAFAQGNGNSAGTLALVQGENNTAKDSFAQGRYNEAFSLSFAQGSNNSANMNSFTQGGGQTYIGIQGSGNTAYFNSFTQGNGNYAYLHSFAQGEGSSAKESSLSQGKSNSAYLYSIAQGLANKADYHSFAQGINNYAHTESLAQGNGCSADTYSMAQGDMVTAIGPGAFAQGYQNSASQRSLAQGISNTANGGLAQGYRNLSEDGAAIGTDNTAKNNSFTLGTKNSAFETSIAQGFDNIAQYHSFAQGIHNSAYEGGLAQGTNNYASAASIAVGDRTSAEHYSQAFGVGTTAGNNGMAIGAYNKTTSASFVIGNGTANDARSDLFVIYPDGSVSAQGKISANGVELGAGGGSTIDGEVVNYVVSNSANIQAASASAVNVYNTVNTNSASWVAGASTLSSLMEYGDNVNFTALSSQIAQGIYPSIRFKLLNWVSNVATYFWHEAKLNPSYSESDPYGKNVDYVQWVANIYARPDNAHFNSDTSSSPRFMTFNFGYDPYSHEWTSAGYSAFSNM